MGVECFTWRTHQATCYSGADLPSVLICVYLLSKNSGHMLVSQMSDKGYLSSDRKVVFQKKCIQVGITGL